MLERFILFILIGLAGAMGALARLGVTSFTWWILGFIHPDPKAHPHDAPLRAAAATLAVNIIGSFLFGFIFAWTEPRMPGSLQLRVLLLIGFMGSFTTFSTFSFDVVRLARDGQWLAAAAYILMSVATGVGGLLVGLAAGARGEGG